MDISIKVTNTDAVPLRAVVRQMPEFADAELSIDPGQSGELQSSAGRETMIMIGTSGVVQKGQVEITNNGAPVRFSAPQQFGNVSGDLASGATHSLEFISSRHKSEKALAAVISVTA